MSNARINPRHRKIDFERLAEAILDISIDLDDEVARLIGQKIRQQVEQPKDGAA